MGCSTPSFPVLHHLPFPRACSNSCPLSQWCHPTILSSVLPFSSCLQYFPASGSFLMSQLFASGSQSIGASGSGLIIPTNIHGWFLLGLNDLISLLSKMLSRVFSSTTVQKHQFFRAQLSLWFSTHIQQKSKFANKGPSSQSYGFPSSHVQMWELGHKESWALKNWCFWTVVLEKTLESPLDCKEIQPASPKVLNFHWKDWC